MRRDSRTTGDLDDGVLDLSPGPRQIAAEREFHLRVAETLVELSDDERETVVQHLYAGLAFREIAELRGRPMGTVTSWYRRGIARLREELKEA